MGFSVKTRHILIWGFCAAFAIAAPSLRDIKEVDIDRTIAQVEAMLKVNPQLPRLTRDDILALLEDIRAQDERLASSERNPHERTTQNPTSTESIKIIKKPEAEDQPNRINFELTDTNNSDELNEIPDDFNILNYENNEVTGDKSDLSESASSPAAAKVETATNKSEPLMVVLPYTPKDGTTLQELYTRPPRVTMVRAPSPMKVFETVKKSKDNKGYESVTEKITVERRPHHSSTKPKKVHFDVIKPYPDVTSELREFLELHGLKGNEGPSDHFLLPLDGFKPLPPVRVIDDSIELPESILLKYDLASTGKEKSQNYDSVELSQDSFTFAPIRPDSPYDLESLPSNQEETVYPLDLPKKRITKSKGSVETSSPNYEPINYDSVKVIPLKSGPSPIVSNDRSESGLKIDLLDVSKRQSNESASIADENTSRAIVESDSETTTTKDESAKSDSADTSISAAAADVGASVADLESSFGGPAPETPGDSMLPPPRKNGFYWMLDWNSFLEVGDGDRKVNIRFEPKLGDPQMFLPVSVP